MPFIEEKNLVDLHKLIEKGEEDLNQISRELKVESDKLEHAQFIKKVLAIVVGLLIFGLIYSFTHYNSSNEVENTIIQAAPQSEIQQPEDSALIALEEETTTEEEGLVYRVQIGAFQNFNIESLGATQSDVISKRTSNGKFTYAVGNFATYAGASELKANLKELGFKDAFIVATNNGDDISIEEALELSDEIVE